MATNEIVVFAGSPTANVESQPLYEADPLRTEGNQPGIAEAPLNNKALRQATLLAAGLAQWIADNQTTNIVDTLTPAQIAALIQGLIQNGFVAKTSDTGAAKIPVGPNSGRPLTAIDGMFRLNTQTNLFEGYIAGTWVPVGYFDANAFVPQVNGVTGSASIPAGTTAQRPALPPVGSQRYNTDNKLVEVHIGSNQWVAVGGYNPAGEVAAFAMNAVPSGWLACDGAEISRTTYANLFAAIGTTFGAGNGSTTFNVPNMRGVFARGIDNGRGQDPGRVFGSFQNDGFAAHSHSITMKLDRAPASPGNAVFGDEPYYGQTDIGTNPTGGSETRPKNIALLYCIRF